MSRFRPAGFRKWADRMAARLATRWRAACTAAEHRISRGWTAWRRRASRNPAAPRNAVSPWEAGAPRSAASRWEAAANPWLGAIARCSRTGSSNPSPSSEESANFRSLKIRRSAHARICSRDPPLSCADIAVARSQVQILIADDGPRLHARVRRLAVIALATRCLSLGNRLGCWPR